ncbi:MAG TPA: hypothetical protein VFQ61_34555 [Polyangiaceae bacterium]|nr:hypothetical protein [Polyangiaceae bacterium]
MSPKLDGPLPIEALRDLLGICRALYAAWKESGVGPVELDELGEIGRELRAALKLARTTQPNTIGHRAAWSRAEQATARLGHLVSTLEPLRPTVLAATRRLCGFAASRQLSQREAKKKHARMRG